MILIKETEELEEGKEYYLEYDGNKIKAYVNEIDYPLIYFVNPRFLTGEGYFKHAPTEDFSHLYEPNNLSHIFKIIQKNPVLQMRYLSIKQNVHKTLHTDRCFYSLQEIYYYDPEDEHQLLNFYITRHSDANRVTIYLPTKDAIIEANNRTTLRMIMEKYTCPDLVEYVEEMGFL
jgi:hypothetical protein